MEHCGDGAHPVAERIGHLPEREHNEQQDNHRSDDNRHHRRLSDLSADSRRHLLDGGRVLIQRSQLLAERRRDLLGDLRLHKTGPHLPPRTAHQSFFHRLQLLQHHVLQAKLAEDVANSVFSHRPVEL